MLCVQEAALSLLMKGFLMYSISLGTVQGLHRPSLGLIQGLMTGCKRLKIQGLVVAITGLISCTHELSCVQLVLTLDVTDSFL